MAKRGGHHHHRHGIYRCVLDSSIRDSRGTWLRGAAGECADVKNVPGRKTDVNDAQWLQQLHQHGLVRGEFSSARWRRATASIPAPSRTAVEYAAAHIQHMQKALMQMNVQLQHVVTDITGVTGMRIIRAIVSGTHAPEKLRVSRCPLRGLATDHCGGANRKLPLGAHLCVASSGGVVRFPSGQDRGV